MALIYKTGLIICCLILATEVGSRSIFNDSKWFFKYFFGFGIFLVCILVCAIRVVQSSESCKSEWIKWSAVYFDFLQRMHTLWHTLIFCPISLSHFQKSTVIQTCLYTSHRVPKYDNIVLNDFEETCQSEKCVSKSSLYVQRV